MSKKRKWELRHDILAPRIWAMLPEQDRKLREVQRSLIQRQRDYAEGTGSMLGEPELEAWRAYRPQLEELPDVPTEALRFFDESEATLKAEKEKAERKRAEELAKERRLRGEAETSRQQAEDKARQARKRTRVAVVLAVLAGIVLLFALQQCDRADRRADEANQAQQADSLKAIELGIALGEAKKAKRKAQKSEDNAREQEMIAKNALNESRRMAARTVPFLLREADNYILALQYDTALVRAQAAWDLNAKRAQVVRTFQEIAYFYTESNALDKAGTALDYIGRSPRRRSNQQEALRAVVKKIDFAYWRDTLETRYYPDMVEVPGGTFQMGCDSTKLKEIFGADEDCPLDEFPQHKVTLDSFRIARTETTVWQYYLYTQADTMRSMPSEPIWGWKGNHPVVNASWYDVLAYANWLSTRRGEKKQVYNLDIPKDANELRKQEDSIDWWDSAIVRWELGGFRLPTEAEWEYAARGGPNSNGYLFAGSDSPEKVAIFDVVGGTRPVRSKKENELGIYDMSGNVWEWCWDWYGEDFFFEPKANPRGAKSGSSRVLRGGSWYNDCTIALRSTFARRIASTAVRGAGTATMVSGCPRAISLFSFTFLPFMARSASKFFILPLVSVRFRTILSGFARGFVEQQQYEQPSLVESQQQQSEEQEQQQWFPVVPALYIFL